MKHLAFFTAALLALTLMGGCSNNSTTTDNNTTVQSDDNDSISAPKLSCTATFGGAAVPTPEQLTTFAGEYVGAAYTTGQTAGEFTPTGDDVLINFSNTGIFTLDSTVYTAKSTCYIPVDNMIFLEFENGAHVDLKTNFEFSGFSAADSTLLISNIL